MKLAVNIILHKLRRTNLRERYIYTPLNRRVIDKVLSSSFLFAEIFTLNMGAENLILFPSFYEG